MNRHALVTGAVVLLLAGCGGGANEDAAETAATPAATTRAGPPETLPARYERVAESIQYANDDEAVRELLPGDRALYVLLSVDSWISNSGFSQYVHNSISNLHDEAVEGAHLIGASETATLLERLPGVLGAQTVPNDQLERDSLLDRLTAEGDAEVNRMDDAWHSGISVEIEAKLVSYLETHPGAFSVP